MATGVVKWFSAGKGYGFIEQDGGGPDVLAHYRSIVGIGYKGLAEGEKVIFDVQQGRKGLEAANIVRG